MTTEHQPGSPPVDLDELDRLHAAATQPDWWLGDDGCVYAGSAPNVVDVGETDWGARDEQLAIELRNAYPALSAELRTLRTRVVELEKLRCLSCGCEILFDGPPESAEELRGTNLYCEMCETPIEADEHRHQLETFREELASLRTRAESAEARVTALEARRFPIMNGPSIPWEMIAPYENQAQKNHSQSLERLAERGGLDPSEALAVLESRRWHTMDPAFALASLAEAVLRWKDRPLQARITALESQLAAARSNSAQLSEELRAVGEELARVREGLPVRPETVPALLRAILEVEKGGSGG